MGLFNRKKVEPQEVKEVKIVEVKEEAKKGLPQLDNRLKYLGEGPLSGEYRFEGLAGSVGAASVEDAFEKANEIALKHPDLLVK